MKVLIIITTAFVPYGGLTSVMMNLYRKIDKQRFKIDFASTNSELDEALQLELSENGSQYFPLGDRKRHLKQYIDRLDVVIKRGNYDIVHINSNSATAVIELCIAKKYNVSKRIVHNHTSICDHKMLHFFCYPFFRSSYTHAIACSKKAGEWIFKDGGFLILNNGIDTERYRFSQGFRTQIRTQHGIRESTIVIGHVGKIYKPKNHHFLVDVFDAYHSINRDSVLLLVGDGQMRKEIEETVKKRGLRGCVIFAGMQKHVEQFLSAMDVFVFPSIWEGMPLSVIEAQASGLNCFISDAIDKGVCITDSIQQLSINDGELKWANAVASVKSVDRKTNSENNIVKLGKNGYDTKSNARLLEKIYNGEPTDNYNAEEKIT